MGRKRIHAYREQQAGLIPRAANLVSSDRRIAKKRMMLKHPGTVSNLLGLTHTPKGFRDSRFWGVTHRVVGRLLANLPTGSRLYY